MLYLVPTPIGNLKDFTFRAVETLQAVDFILCEDTRTSSKLLQHYQIQKPLTPFHQHNEHKIVEHLVQQLMAGKNIALITDAGTPGISDPAFLLVRACKAAGVPVTSLPGATAFVPALVASGFPCDKFVFEGFLPHKKGRQTRIQALALENRTVVLYESPHRIAKTLSQMCEWLDPQREACVVREISKKFETYHRGTLAELQAYFSQNEAKGEIVLLLKGNTE